MLYLFAICRLVPPLSGAMSADMSNTINYGGSEETPPISTEGLLHSSGNIA